MDAHKDQPVLIAVMGATGTGKSTFINVASGSKLAVGDELGSCTFEVQLSKPFMIDNRTVVLVDTPGFDDSFRGEADILRSIAEFLTSTYEKGRKLSGLIFLHRIADNRVGGVARKNFRLFRAICGDDALKHVVIATTMWSETSEGVGSQRERELSTNDHMFKPALEMGAKLVRHANSVSSAHGIIKTIVGSNPQTLSIQAEIVDQQSTLPGTTVGRQMRVEADAAVTRYSDKKEEIEAGIRSAQVRERDTQYRALLDQLQAELCEVREKLQMYEAQVQKLESETDAEREEKERLERGQKQLEQGQRWLRQDQERIEREQARLERERERLEREQERLEREQGRLGREWQEWRERKKAREQGKENGNETSWYQNWTPGGWFHIYK